MLRDEGVLVESAYQHVVHRIVHGQGRIGRKGPGRSGPRQEIHVAFLAPGLGQGVLYRTELCRYRRVGHVAVAPRLVQFVAGKPRARLGRIRLDGISLVQQAFGVDLRQKPPYGLHVFRLVGDVRVLHVHPVTDAAGQFVPLVRVAHHHLTAIPVVVLHRDLLADVLLGNAQFLFHTQLYRQPVGIPASLALHLIAAQGLVPAKDVLDRAGHHVMDPRHAVGRRRPFEKDEGRSALALRNGLLEDAVLLPIFQFLSSQFGEVQLLVLSEFFIAHNFLPAGNRLACKNLRKYAFFRFFPPAALSFCTFVAVTHKIFAR